MEKENWINEVMQSTRGMKPAEANPFLFEKIALKIEQRKTEAINENSFSKGWAVAAVLLVVINIISLTFMMQGKPAHKKEASYTALAKDMGLLSTYNY
jgi:hypothetical protein